jgi:hypothetical protein
LCESRILANTDWQLHFGPTAAAAAAAAAATTTNNNCLLTCRAIWIPQRFMIVSEVPFVTVLAGAISYAITGEKLVFVHCVPKCG